VLFTGNMIMDVVFAHCTRIMVAESRQFDRGMARVDEIRKTTAGERSIWAAHAIQGAARMPCLK